VNVYHKKYSINAQAFCLNNISYMRYVPIVFAFLFPMIAAAQYGKDYVLVNNRVIVNYAESTVYAYVLPEKTNKKVADEYMYYWFASNDIKRTRGAFDGRLLHGQYTEFYLNKDLKDKGRMRFGLKEGIWKSWYPNGEYKEIVSYKKSRRLWYRAFYDTGALQSKGKYKNDKLHGIIKNYSPEGKVERAKYRNGINIKQEKKQKRVLKLWKRKNNKSEKDSTLLHKKSENSIRKWLKKEKREEVKDDSKPAPAPYGQPANPGEQQKVTKKDRKKKKENEVKVRKFLWIIPLDPAPRKEKQT
jgi:hypothetical protein